MGGGDDAERAAAARAERLEFVLRFQHLTGPVMWLTGRALRLRRSRAPLFENGDYLPLHAAGERAEHVVAFARRHEGRTVIAVAARFFTRLPDPPTGEPAWGETALALFPEASGLVWRDALAGHELRAAGSGEPRLRLREVFRHLPVALLERAQ